MVLHCFLQGCPTAWIEVLVTWPFIYSYFCLLNMSLAVFASNRYPFAITVVIMFVSFVWAVPVKVCSYGFLSIFPECRVFFFRISLRCLLKGPWDIMKETFSFVGVECAVRLIPHTSWDMNPSYKEVQWAIIEIKVFITPWLALHASSCILTMNT